MTEKVVYDRPGICPRCGGTNEETIKDIIASCPCEIETTCRKCGHKDYWAYGWYASTCEED